MITRAKTRALGQKIGNVEKKVIKTALPDKWVTGAKNKVKQYVADRKTASKNWEGRMNNENYYRGTSYWKDHTN